MKIPEIVVTIGAAAKVSVSDENHLRTLLVGLDSLQNGEIATLERGPSDFVRATRHGELWSVTTKRGPMWFAQSFTAAFTSDHSERRVRESRAYGSLSQHLLGWLRSPPPERALSTSQVRTIFSEYATDRKFTLPFSGA